MTENLPPSKEHVIPRVIEEEMKQAYVDYAMSVIVGRALPDVRDGLKPVHRRILYAMNENGMFHNRPFKKCARIVGEVLGKYHPHGDIAVYDSLVRLAQDFSLRYPLIKGQGNFGSLDGDKAAAQRYTEAKLNKLAEEMLQDIEKETVSWRDNFDGSLKEPEVLPGKVPNLLINGSSGIAVGMATNIPPHNLVEICQGVIELINNPEVTVEELMEIVKGPDFPTGGEIFVGKGLLYAYKTGRGKITIRSVVKNEENRLVITEIPYQVNKVELIEQIAELVRDKKIIGIRNINDESDRDGIRVVIDLKKDVDSSVILNQLFKYSRLKITFGINLLALVDNEPRTLSLVQMLQHFLTYRKEVIRKRTLFDLTQAEQRVHVLEGLIVALDNIDQVIPGIKNSKTVDEAKDFLIKQYSLTEIQARAILDLKLQKLASLEQDKIKSENSELKIKITEYHTILNSEEKILLIIKQELTELITNYGDSRRSKVVINDEDETDFELEQLIEKENVVVTMTHGGYIKRIQIDSYKTQRRGGKGVKSAVMKEEDFVEQLFVCSTHDHLLFFTDQGQVYWLKVYNIPEANRLAKGKHLSNLIELKEENITAIIPIESFNQGYLVMATEKGIIKKTDLMEFSRPRNGGIRALNLDQNDHLVGVKLTDGTKQIILASRKGAAIRFKEEDVRSMGRTAYGVHGIKLDEGDRVVGMVIAEEGKQVLTLTEKGYGKQTNVEEYRLVGRGGKGVTNLKITEKNGDVSYVTLLSGEEELLLMSKNGVAIRIKSQDVPHVGRVTQGVRLMKLNDQDIFVVAAKILDSEDEVSEEE